MSALICTLSGADGLRLTVSTLGAAWLSCRVPLRGGESREVLLGHPDPDLYPQEGGFVGQFIGRYANRIAGARFALPGGGEARLAANEGGQQLHGGPGGFHTRPFELIDTQADSIRLRLHSADGDQGFPGDLNLDLRYRLLPGLRVRVEWVVRCSAPCPVNLTHHAYFNLDAEHLDVRQHRLRILGSRYLPVGQGMLPTGEVRPVAGTAFDLRGAPLLQAALAADEPQQRLVGQGFDHNWLLDDGEQLAAELSNADLRLQIRTDLPGLQCYSGQFLTESRSRDGSPYRRHAGLALEPQYFPDSPNRPEWPQPSCWLLPGAEMRHFIDYQFSLA